MDNKISTGTKVSVINDRFSNINNSEAIIVDYIESFSAYQVVIIPSGTICYVDELSVSKLTTCNIKHIIDNVEYSEEELRLIIQKAKCYDGNYF